MIIVAVVHLEVMVGLVLIEVAVAEHMAEEEEDFNSLFLFYFFKNYDIIFLVIFMNNLILIKYGELTTKKANRNAFTKLLANNIKNLLKGEEFNLKFDRVRMYIECNNAEIF